MSIRNEILEPDRFYHIFNRGINSQPIFLNNENYLYFLRKVYDYLYPVLEIYSYCLMPNHFHLLIKIKSEDVLTAFWNKKPKKNENSGLHMQDKIVSKQFADLFNSYTQAFNKMHSRKGSLLDSPFKRKKIDTEQYLRTTIIYIHQNPEAIVTNFRDYKYSSYQAVVSNAKTNIKREEIINLFEDKNNFKISHNSSVDFDL